MFQNITTGIITQIVEAIPKIISAALSGDFGGISNIFKAMLSGPDAFMSGLAGNTSRNPGGFTASAATQREFEAFKAEVDARNIAREQLKQQRETNRLLMEQRLAYR